MFLNGLMTSLWLLIALSLYDLYLRAPQYILADWIGLVIPPLLLAGLYAWQRWPRVEVITIPVPTPPLTLEGDVEFDAQYGLVSWVTIQGKREKVVIQPKYWQFLNPALKYGIQETVCAESLNSAVQPGGEPASTVAILDSGDRVIGFGARVKKPHSRKSLLVTAFHVVRKVRFGPIYLAKYSTAEKAVKKVEIARSWDFDFLARDQNLDILALDVPSAVWSLLGVKAADVYMAGQNQVVTCYGGSRLDSLLSTVGTANYRSELSITHTCTTSKGWSGAPVYSSKGIIGIHTSSGDVGINNVATLLWPLMDENETFYDDGILKEVEPEEMVGLEHEETFVHGRGTYKMGQGIYAWVPAEYHDPGVLDRARKRGKKMWADWAEDDEDVDFGDALETLDDDLPGNGSQAQSECSVPCAPSVVTPGNTRVSSPNEGCPSISLEDRVCNLEKLAEKGEIRMQQMLSDISLISKTLIGLKGDLMRKELPSASKQKSSTELNPPPTSQNASGSSSPNTPPSPNGDASNATPGKRKKSKKRSKKSASPKSSETPPQGSQ